MPEIKANEPLPQRPVVIVIYGDPGIGKTSLFNTSKNPYLIDFDRGVSRSINRQDTLAPDNWEEVQEHEKKGTFKDRATIGIDTAKACLDDFLMSYVVKKDFKNQKNKQAAYGALGDEFKVFVNNRRSDRADLVIIAHAKDKEDGDFTRKIPDVTGGSYQLLLRIADQIGYMTMRNNKRTIIFEPTDTSVGKNVARLPLIEIPEEGSPALKTFMADIIESVKKATTSQSEAQAESLQKSETFQKAIAEMTTADDLNMIIAPVQELPKHLKDQINQVIASRAKTLGFKYNKVTGAFEAPPPPPPVTPAKGEHPVLQGPAFAGAPKKQEALPFN